MKCPIDDTSLQMHDRQGVEIDYCPTCRGVWLDRGELDKLIDRSQQFDSPTPAPRQPEYREERPRHEDHHDTPRYDDRHSKPYKKHKKESFLGDLFDF